jgi:hypothetical protein
MRQLICGGFGKNFGAGRQDTVIITIIMSGCKVTKA